MFPLESEAVVGPFVAWKFTLTGSKKEASLRQEILKERELTAAAIEKAVEEKKKLVERFAESAMATLQRKINGGDKELLGAGLAVWVMYLAEVKKEKELLAERARA